MPCSATASSRRAAIDGRINFDDASSAEELEPLGMDVLKEELAKLGAKCGGTLKERCARLFSCRGETNIPDFLKRRRPDLAATASKDKKR